MLIQEFVKQIKDNANLKEILVIRTYVPIAEKRAIFQTIFNQCFAVEDGVLTCDYIAMKMMFELAMIKYHTNLEIDITSESDYDELLNTGIDFHSEYIADYTECHLLFDGLKQEMYSQYSIETSITRLSNRLSNSIDSLVSAIVQKVGSFDMNSFGFENADLDQLKSLLNKYGK